jgi:anion-transporting  ArsA/GET3 family ATPase
VISEYRDEFLELVRQRDIVVCAGSGGVGKTTTSAVLGLQAAIEGQRVLVMTIDPARRLANSLGAESLDNEPTQLDLEGFSEVGVQADGELWAMMLDMKASFDDLVERRAPDEETRQEILNNRLYEYFSTSLAGTQEYAAAERLYEAHSSGDWDLIVLDTPPTTHALDFLEAPSRLANAVESKAFQWIYKRDLGLFSMGSSYVLKTLGKFTGTELLEELSVFLQHFSPMFEGFRDRARQVRELLTGPECTFVVVTSPDPHTRDESIHFYEELGSERVAVGGFIVNRVHPHWVDKEEFDRPVEEIADAIAEAGTDLEVDASFDESERTTLAERLRQNAASFYVLARKDHRSVQELRDELERDIPVATVPFFSRDIHSLSGLDRVRTEIFG